MNQLHSFVPKFLTLTFRPTPGFAHGKLTVGIGFIDRVIVCERIHRCATQRIGLRPATGGWVVVAFPVMVQIVRNASSTGIASHEVVSALEQERVVRRAVGETSGGHGVVAVWPVADGLLEFSTRIQEPDDIALSVVDWVVAGAGGQPLVDDETSGSPGVVAGASFVGLLGGPKGAVCVR